MKWTTRFFLAFVCMFGVLRPLAAQTQNVPPTAEIERQILKFGTKPAGAPAISPLIDRSMVRRESLAIPSGADKVMIKVVGVDFINETTFSKEQLAPLVNRLVNQKNKTLADVYQLAIDITEMHVKRGCYMCVAKVFSQKFEQDNAYVQIAIQEGRIDRVTFVDGLVIGEQFGNRPSESKGKFFDGSPFAKNGTPISQSIFDKIDPTPAGKVRFVGKFKRTVFLRNIAKRLISSRSDTPLTVKDFTYYIQILTELPGVKVTAAFAASKDDDAIDMMHLVIGVKELDVLDKPSLTFDNRGTKAIGPYQIQANMKFNSMLGYYETIDLSTVLTPDRKELKYVSASFTETVMPWGTKLTYSGNLSRSAPGDTLTDLEVRSRSSGLSIKASHPFSRTRVKTKTSFLDLSAAFDFKYSRTNQLGSKTSEDRLYIANAGISYGVADQKEQTKFSFQANVYRGLPILNSTKQSDTFKSRADGQIDFTRFTTDASYSSPLTLLGDQTRFSYTLQGTAQWSNNGLLSSQEFGIGGESYGRAYDSSEITGDYGWAGSLEVRYQLPPFGPKTKRTGNSHLYGFYDGGRVYEKTPVNKPKVESLASAGFGFRMDFTSGASVALELANPLTRIVSNATIGAGKAPRVFFKLAMVF